MKRYIFAIAIALFVLTGGENINANLEQEKSSNATTTYIVEFSTTAHGHLSICRFTSYAGGPLSVIDEVESERLRLANKYSIPLNSIMFAFVGIDNNDGSIE